ncbi:MAG: hypothetical protein Q8R45_03960 [Brevundimonas sp.]|uniref:hypothetical protein n=1 Tax=Brevundimonas sp. TaxID=1871086 RepID=UPI002719F2FE|nr:hypothetical protein [Brevundimonas sp.]MDO9588648.1 hypothetical protein [Brevundimonas sp.]MDP2763260.1 hypothetical protein [Brevundimonas sp.]MDP3368843.1 hypothetical protein [Brevundimonas sp.]MDP3656105.1 hypothetical protein [Brevundimonas sp.]MDZ4110015.1 hypothetical protein [Brevundimonas sp.]
MNGSGIFSIDAPLVMFYLYVFNGLGLLTLLGICLAVGLMGRHTSRKSGFITLVLSALPALYFFVMPRAVAATGKEPSQPIELALLAGFGAACLASPIFGGIALGRREAKVT